MCELIFRKCRQFKEFVKNTENRFYANQKKETRNGVITKAQN